MGLIYARFSLLHGGSGLTRYKQVQRSEMSQQQHEHESHSKEKRGAKRKRKQLKGPFMIPEPVEDVIGEANRSE